MKKAFQLMVFAVVLWIAVGIFLIIMEPMLGVLFLVLGMLSFFLFTTLKPRTWRSIKQYASEAINGREEVTEEAHYSLVMRSPNSGQRFPIQNWAFLIGRSNGCDCVLDGDMTISRKHCRIVYRTHSREYYLEDMNSKKGTYIGTRRLEPYTPVHLLDNSDIIVGDYCLRFERD